MDGDAVLEIFRDDTRKVREITLYKNYVSHEFVEEVIAVFQKEIPWAFQD